MKAALGFLFTPLGELRTHFSHSFVDHRADDLQEVSDC